MKPVCQPASIASISPRPPALILKHSHAHNLMFERFYSGKRVLVTGHTGFKGSWLALWLKKLGATVAGYATEPPTNPNLHSLIHQYVFSQEFIADIRDTAQLERALQSFRPDIIFHLAAQSLVRRSYEQPVDT